jgi:hypothetical protein
MLSPALYLPAAGTCELGPASSHAGPVRKNMLGGTSVHQKTPLGYIIQQV